MVNNILNIVKKELDKVFKSFRQIFSTFILSGLMIFIMYSVIGQTTKKQLEENENHEYNILINVENQNLITMLNNLSINESESYNVVVTVFDITLEELQNEESSKHLAILNKVKSGEADLFIYIENNFSEVISGSTSASTNVFLISHVQNTFSVNMSSILTNYFYYYQSQINPADLYVINAQSIDLASDSEKGNTMLSLLAPLLIITFIFAGALGIGSDSIAGEKERGTIATMIMAPISKNDIVFGKIISAIIITTIASICSTIGLLASVNNLSVDSDEIMVALTFVTILKVLGLILLTSLFAISCFLMASTYAKTTKEASMLCMPIYTIALIAGILAGFSTTLPSSIFHFLIPIYNLALGFKGIFSNSIQGTQLLAIIFSNIIYFVLILFVVKKMFESENIMFKR